MVVKQESSSSAGEWSMKFAPFLHGSIHRVKLTNFMSYSSAELFPGPRLNMVIGPNGSGKSTIVCALALGLGGKPSLLNRASNLKGFVQNGKSRASIEIELVDKNKSCLQVITRELNSKNDSSVWRWNGVEKRGQWIQELLRTEYQTQVDNLCQFLPQDKVSFFSRLNSQNLLRETIRAALGTKRLTDQDELVATQKELKEMTRDARVMEHELEQAKQQLAVIHGQVQLLKEREAVVECIRLYEGKELYLRYQQSKTLYTEAKERTKGKLAEEKQLRKRVHDLEDSLSKKKAQLDALLESIPNLDVESYTSSFEKIQRKRAREIATMDRKIDDLDEELGEQKNCQSRYAQAVSELQKVEQAANEVESATNIADTRKRQREVVSQIKVLEPLVYENRQERLVCDKKREGLLRSERRTKERLQKLASASQDREQIFWRLSSRDRREKVIKIWRHIQEMRVHKELRQDVHLPLLEVSMDDKLLVKYFESTVNEDQLCTFVTQNQEDRDKIMQINNADVINLNAGPGPVKRVAPGLKEKYGLLGTLSELINAPPPVRAALEALAAIDKVYCGSQGTEGSLNVESGDFVDTRVLTPSTLYAFARSRYGNQLTTVTTKSLSRPRLFEITEAEDTHMKKASHEKDLADLRRQFRELEAEAEKMAAKGRKSQQALDRLLEEKESLHKDLLKVHKLKKRLEDSRERVKKAEKDLSADRAARLMKHVDMYMHCKTSIVDSVSNAVREAEKYKDIMDTWLLGQVKVSKLSSSCEKDQALKASLAANHELALEEIASLKQEAHDAKQRTRELLQEFKTTMPDATVAGPETEKLQQLSDDIEDIRAELRVLRDKRDRMLNDPALLVQYENLKAKVAKLEPLVLNKEADQKERAQRYELERDAWLDDMKRLLAKIDLKFREGFKAIQAQGYACDGEVEPIVDLDDLAQCGVGINVRFRADAPLQRLCINVQSGGERSLCTFMYMLSLNEVSHCPFRVVDEINQGMDEEKERISFYQLMGSSCGDSNRAQYFLVTPKLLSGLRYHEDITFHVVYNGKGALPQEDFKFRDMLERKRLSQRFSGKSPRTAKKRRRSRGSS